MSFFWNEEKNTLLKKTRNISFERIVVAIESGNILDIIDNPNEEKYKNQVIIVVKVDNYAYCVPCVTDFDGNTCMKTIFPSRKFTKLYILEDKK